MRDEATWPYPTSDEVSHLACTDVGVLRARIDQLIEERHGLKARVGDFEGELRIPYRLRLSAQERRLVEALARARGMVTKERLHVVLSDSPEPDTEIKIVDVLVCKVRRKLRAADMPSDAILTHWGQGYSLTPEMRAYLRA